MTRYRDRDERDSKRRRFPSSLSRPSREVYGGEQRKRVSGISGSRGWGMSRFKPHPSRRDSHVSESQSRQQWRHSQQRHQERRRNDRPRTPPVHRSSSSGERNRQREVSSTPKSSELTVQALLRDQSRPSERKSHSFSSRPPPPSVDRSMSLPDNPLSSPQTTVARSSSDSLPSPELRDRVSDMNDSRYIRTSTTRESHSISAPLSSSASPSVPSASLISNTMSVAPVSQPLPPPQNSGLTKEQLLCDIERTDVEITKVEIEIERLQKLKAKQENELKQSTNGKSLEMANEDVTRLMQSRNNGIICPQKNVIEEIYCSNRERAELASAMIDNGASEFRNDCASSEHRVFKQNEKIFSNIYEKLKKVVESRLCVRKGKGLALFSQYQQMYKRWKRSIRKKEKALVAEDDREAAREAAEMDINELVAKLDEEERRREKWKRSLAAIPPQLVDEEERRISHFVSSNCRVDDCMPDYVNRRIKEKAWTDDEKKTFLEKYLVHPKNFHRIATALPNKNVADVVCYYYNNKKSLNLKKMLERQIVKKRGRTVLIEEGGSRKSLPVVDGHSDSTAISVEQKDRPRKEPDDSLWWTEEERDLFIEFLKEYGKDFRKISIGIGTKDINQCRNFFQNHRKDLFLDDYLPSLPPGKEKRKKEKSNGGPGKKRKRSVCSWTEEERSMFLKMLPIVGRNWTLLHEAIPTKDVAQIRNFFQNYKNKLSLEDLLPPLKPVKSDSPTEESTSKVESSSSGADEQKMDVDHDSSANVENSVVKSEESSTTNIEEVGTKDREPQNALPFCIPSASCNIVKAQESTNGEASDEKVVGTENSLENPAPVVEDDHPVSMEVEPTVATDHSDVGDNCAILSEKKENDTVAVPEENQTDDIVDVGKNDESGKQEEESESGVLPVEEVVCTIIAVENEAMDGTSNELGTNDGESDKEKLDVLGIHNETSELEPANATLSVSEVEEAKDTPMEVDHDENEGNVTSEAVRFNE